MNLRFKLWHGLSLALCLMAALAWAADTRITDLSELALGSPAPGDWIECVDTSDTTDNAAGSSRKCKMSSVYSTRYKLGSDYTNSTTTGTEVTGIGPITVAAAGTYHLQCVLVIRSAATTTGIKFGVNYTGTTTLFTAHARFPSSGVSASIGQIEDDVNATTGQIWAYAATVTETTTAPNLGPWTGVVTANANNMVHVEALMVVSNTGDIELWAGSEVAASAITIMAGSFCTVTTL